MPSPPSVQATAVAGVEGRWLRDVPATCSRVDGVLIVPDPRRQPQQLAQDLGVMARLLLQALAAGLRTQRGARTSHAAVVARQLGKVHLGHLRAAQGPAAKVLKASVKASAQ